VIALDIFPTAMAAAGIEKSPGKPLDGTNLLPLMTGKSKELPHKTLYWKMGNTWAVRDGNLKLVAVNGQPGGATAQLFDLAQDPSETTDLSSKQPEEAKRLRALYDAWVTTHQPTPWGKGKTEPKAGQKRKKKAAQ
jgi:arylsulfatase A-like enzyme